MVEPSNASDYSDFGMSPGASLSETPLCHTSTSHISNPEHSRLRVWAQRKRNPFIPSPRAIHQQTLSQRQRALETVASRSPHSSLPSSCTIIGHSTPLYWCISFCPLARVLSMLSRSLDIPRALLVTSQYRICSPVAFIFMRRHSPISACPSLYHIILLSIQAPGISRLVLLQ